MPVVLSLIKVLSANRKAVDFLSECLCESTLQKITGLKVNFYRTFIATTFISEVCQKRAQLESINCAF